MRASDAAAVAANDTGADGVDTRLIRERLQQRMFGGDGQPVRLGRFVVERRLGAGAMGVVWAAHDPELDRRVAIKLLTADVDAAELGSRLRREAQAMAKLAHPNVVAVHEVGEHEGAPFVAMELVDGTTLRQWLEDVAHPRAEVLAMFAAAGAGLAAAHEAGLVHRDFKPDNVLVGRDGRARVGDFGLVRAQPPGPAPRERAERTATETTHSSELAGTPAYMAPEIFEGAPPSARGDQYAFCIALFEAIYRTRPHAASSVPALIERRLAGEVVFPARPRVSRRLQRLLARGLARDPQRRFPTMGALLETLERVRHPPRVAWLVAGASMALAGAGLVAVLVDRAPACADSATVIAASWDEPHRERVRAALADDGLPIAYSGGVAQRLEQRLDDWVAHWRDVHADACVAGDLGTRSTQLVERQLLCLERRRFELEGFVAALEGSAAAVTGRALQAAVALPSPTICSELDGLIDDVDPPDPTIAGAVAEVRAALALAKSTADVAADADGALRQAEGALATAEQLGYPPLVAEAELRVALSHAAKGDFPTARDQLERAYFDAIAADHEVVALQTAGSLLHTIGVRLGKPADALVWWDHGEALLRKRGPSPRDAAQLESSRAAVLSEMGKHADALPVAVEAVAHAEEGYGDDHPNTFTARQNLAGAQLGLAQFEDALTTYQGVVAGLERLYGEDHPATASALQNTAIALSNLGRHAEALAEHERALAIFQRTIGGDTMEAGFTLGNMANVHGRLGDQAAALASAHRAKLALAAAMGPDNPRTIMLGGNIGHIHLRLGQLEAARIALEETIAGLERIDPRHHELPNNLDRLGMVALAYGDCERSLAHHRRAREIATAIGLPPHTIGYQQLNLGNALDCLARPDEAIVELEGAIAAWTKAHGEASRQVDNGRRALSGTLVHAGRFADALALTELLVKACDAKACDDATRSDVLVVQAEALLGLGRVHEARTVADRALVLRTAAGGSAWALGDVRWVAARARHADGVPIAELGELLARARASLHDAGRRGDDALARWPAWARAADPSHRDTAAPR